MHHQFHTHTNVRDVKLGGTHTQINRVGLRSCSSPQWDAAKMSTYLGGETGSTSRSSIASWERETASGYPGQLIKLALLGSIISLVMLLPRDPSTIYTWKGCSKAQLRGKSRQGKGICYLRVPSTFFCTRSHLVPL